MEISQEIKLKRSLSLPLITFYGIGTILGAGIYVLIGEVAAKAGMFTPLSFICASFIAAFSAFSFAELSSRLPKSAGEAFYMQVAFKRRTISTAVGVMVVSIGVISAAAIVRGFTGYLQVFVQVPDWLAISCLVCLLGSVAIWGIMESAVTISIVTIIEISGLLIIVWVGADSLQGLPARMPELIPPLSWQSCSSVFAGAILAFYAFIGFEDMVNVAEEVRKPEINLPVAIILSLVITTVLYIIVSMVAILSLPLEKLAGSKAPLALIYEYKTGNSPSFIALISLFAVTNGALVQIIMASRVLYGLGKQGWLPSCLAGVNTVTRTPFLATILVTGTVLMLALWLPLVTLAHITSFVTLAVFACINGALIVIKRRDPQPVKAVTYPGWIPFAGLFSSSGVIILELLRIILS